MSQDHKNFDNDANRYSEFNALAKEYKAANPINQYKILERLVENKDEEALIWLHENNIINLREPYLNPDAPIDHQGKEWLLRKAIHSNLLNFVEYICQNVPQAFKPMDYSKIKKLSGDPIAFYKYAYVDLARSADMAGLFIKYLPEYDVNDRGWFDGKTILQSLAYGFHSRESLVDVIKLVLLHGASIHSKYVDDFGENKKRKYFTLLQELADSHIPYLAHIEKNEKDERHCLEIIKFLAAQGASIEGLDEVYDKIKRMMLQLQHNKNSQGFLQSIVGFFSKEENKDKTKIMNRLEQAINSFKEAIKEGQKLGPMHERYQKILEASQSMGVGAEGISKRIHEYDSSELAMLESADESKKKNI